MKQYSFWVCVVVLVLCFCWQVFSLGRMVERPEHSCERGAEGVVEEDDDLTMPPPGGVMIYHTNTPDEMVRWEADYKTHHRLTIWLDRLTNWLEIVVEPSKRAYSFTPEGRVITIQP